MLGVEACLVFFMGGKESDSGPRACLAKQFSDTHFPKRGDNLLPSASSIITINNKEVSRRHGTIKMHITTTITTTPTCHHLQYFEVRLILQ